MIKVKIGTQTVEYKHVLKPIKDGNEFKPNWDELNEIIRKSHLNILRLTFAKYQKEGKTILINYAGGWCTLTKDMEIVK